MRSKLRSRTAAKRDSYSGVPAQARTAAVVEVVTRSSGEAREHIASSPFRLGSTRDQLQQDRCVRGELDADCNVFGSRHGLLSHMRREDGFARFAL